MSYPNPKTPIPLLQNDCEPTEELFLQTFVNEAHPAIKL